MKTLELNQLEKYQGGQGDGSFLDGFCAVGTFIAILNGGANPVANVIAAGCFLRSIL